MRSGGHPILLALEQLFNGTDLGKKEGGDVDAGAEGFQVPVLEGGPKQPGLVELDDIFIVLLADLLDAGGDLSGRELSGGHSLGIAQKAGRVKKPPPVVLPRLPGGMPPRYSLTGRKEMKRSVLFWGITIGLVASAALFAQSDAKKGDPSLTRQLDRMGVDYTITDSGNYSIDYTLDNGRSQTAYIMGETQTVDNLEVREIWSRAGTFDSLPSADVMQSLLEESGTKEIGFWSLEKTKDGGYILYFSVKVPVYLKDDDLSSLLQYTADTADQKEQELFNTDNE